MLPPAPVTFSTTTVCPRLFVIRSAMMRAIVSVGPPAENGTTIATGRAGKFCADAALQQAASATVKSRNLFMPPPLRNILEDKASEGKLSVLDRYPGHTRNIPTASKGGNAPSNPRSTLAHEPTYPKAARAGIARWRGNGLRPGPGQRRTAPAHFYPGHRQRSDPGPPDGKEGDSRRAAQGGQAAYPVGGGKTGRADRVWRGPAQPGGAAAHRV